MLSLLDVCNGVHDAWVDVKGLSRKMQWYARLRYAYSFYIIVYYLIPEDLMGGRRGGRVSYACVHAGIVRDRMVQVLLSLPLLPYTDLH